MKAHLFQYECTISAYWLPYSITQTNYIIDVPHVPLHPKSQQPNCLCNILFRITTKNLQNSILQPLSGKNWAATTEFPSHSVINGKYFHDMISQYAHGYTGQKYPQHNQHIKTQHNVTHIDSHTRSDNIRHSVWMLMGTPSTSELFHL